MVDILHKAQVHTSSVDKYTNTKIQTQPPLHCLDWDKYTKRNTATFALSDQRQIHKYKKQPWHCLDKDIYKKQPWHCLDWGQWQHWYPSLLPPNDQAWVRHCHGWKGRTPVTKDSYSKIPMPYLFLLYYVKTKIGVDRWSSVFTSPGSSLTATS